MVYHAQPRVLKAMNARDSQGQRQGQESSITTSLQVAIIGSGRSQGWGGLGAGSGRCEGRREGRCEVGSFRLAREDCFQILFLRLSQDRSLSLAGLARPPTCGLTPLCCLSFLSNLTEGQSGDNHLQARAKKKGQKTSSKARRCGKQTPSSDPCSPCICVMTSSGPFDHQLEHQNLLHPAVVRAPSNFFSNCPNPVTLSLVLSDPRSPNPER